MSDDQIINTIAEAIEATDYDWSYAPGVTTGTGALRARAVAILTALDAEDLIVTTKYVSGYTIMAVAEWLDIHHDGLPYEIFHSNGEGGGYRMTVEKIENPYV